MKQIPLKDPLNIPLQQYPIALLDYAYVIFIYVSLSFWLAVLIDGYILPKFDTMKEKKKSSFILYFEITLQIALQGFVAIISSLLLQRIPSPFTNVFNYNPHSSLGIMIRNPAIIYIILFISSKTLQARLSILFNRFDKNGNALTNLHP